MTTTRTGKTTQKSRSNPTQVAQPFSPRVYAIGRAYEHMQDRRVTMVTKLTKPKLITFEKISRKYCLKTIDLSSKMVNKTPQH